MNVSPPTATGRPGGFTLAEMMVNLSIVGMLLFGIAGSVIWSSETVTANTGRLSAMEKSSTVRDRLAWDLARVPPDGVSSLVCRADAGSWTLDLSLPVRDGGKEIVQYTWNKSSSVLRRRTDAAPGADAIATGVASVESDWLETLVSKSAGNHVPTPSWNVKAPPAFLKLKIATTRAADHSPDDRESDAGLATSDFTLLLPVATR